MFSIIRGALNAGAKFIIGTEYTDDVPFKRQYTSLRKQRQSNLYLFKEYGICLHRVKKLTSRLDIYVMNGGKIIGSKDITIDAQKHPYYSKWRKC